MNIKFKKINKFLIGASVNIAQHLFLSCLALFFLTLVIGGILFYRYNILSPKSGKEEYTELEIKEKIYQEVLGAWQKREEKFQSAGLKEYPDLFRPSSGLTE